MAEMGLSFMYPEMISAILSPRSGFSKNGVYKEARWRRGTGISKDGWKHIAVSMQGSISRFYVNGQLVFTSSAGVAIAAGECAAEQLPHRGQKENRGRGAHLEPQPIPI
jgi:hypothetical protein